MNEETKRLVEGAEFRADATTPGPWRDSRYHEDEFGPHIENEVERTVAVCSLDVLEHDANGFFIAHARQDVPALCATVRKIDAERDEAIKLLTAISQGEYLEGTSAGCAVDDFLARLKP